MSDKTFNPVMANLICPVCAKQMPVILINQKLTKKAAAEMDKVSGQNIGFTEEPCDECKELMDQGDIIIGVDMEKTTDMHNPYRSGHFAVIKKGILPKPVQYMDYREMIKLRLIDE